LDPFKLMAQFSEESYDIRKNIFISKEFQY
jgi:hypothetical protein